MNYLSATFILPISVALFLLLWVSILESSKATFMQRIIWKFIPIVLAVANILLAFGVIK